MPRLLDLFCGAGGCTKGYQRAGFYVVGVDINPQPNMKQTGLPYVIENVPGAPMRRDLVLCGCQFGLRSPRGLGVRRERWFETEPLISTLVPPHDHREPALPVTGHSPGKEWRIRMADFGEAPGIDERRKAMDVEWMNRQEASEAIPPAYTEFIGRHLLSGLEARLVA